MVTRCHLGQSHGVWRPSRVSSCSLLSSSKNENQEAKKTKIPVHVHALRRVHITEATLKHLNKAYEVEEGNGHLRDPYLKELNVHTYLVIDPRVSYTTYLHVVRMFFSYRVLLAQYEFFSFLVQGLFIEESECS